MKKEHLILFYDKTALWVDEKTYGNIVEESGNPSSKKFELNGCVYAFSDIKRMQEPRQGQYSDFSSVVDSLTRDKTPEKRMVALEKMAKGLKKYIESKRYRGTDGPKNILKKMRESYTEAKTAISK